MKAGRIILVLMAAFVTAVLAVSSYVVAYLSLGEYHDWRPALQNGPTNHVERHYADKEWCLTFFAPAAAVESKWIGCPVYLTKREWLPPPDAIDDIQMFPTPQLDPIE